MLSLKHASKNGQSLSHIDTSFRDRELVCILCDQEETKQDLFNILCGIDHYDKGDLLINGYSTQTFQKKEWTAYRKLYVGTTKIAAKSEQVNHVVEMEMAFMHMPKKKALRQVKNTLYQVAKAVDKKAVYESLSNYEKWCVKLAKAIVKNPQLVLIDEDFSGLNEEEKKNILSIIEEIADECLVIIFSEVENADRYIEISNGEIIRDTQPLFPKQKYKGKYRLPNANMSARVIWELTKRHFKEHLIHNVFLVILALFPLWFKRGTIPCILISCLWYLNYKKNEFYTLKQGGASTLEIVEITLFQLCFSLFIASLICFIFGKLDVWMVLLFGILLVIITCICVKIELR